MTSMGYVTLESTEGRSTLKLCSWHSTELASVESVSKAFETENRKLDFAGFLTIGQRFHIGHVRRGLRMAR